MSRAEFERVIAQRDEFKSKVRGLEDSAAAKTIEELQSQNQALQEQVATLTEADAKAKADQQERDRLDRRRQFVDTVLSRVSEDKREDFELMLAGLEQKGEVSVPDENPVEAAEEAITKLADRYPGFFSSGGSGPTSPVGPGSGPMPKSFMDLSPEQQKAMSDEDFAKNFGGKARRQRRKTGLFG